MRPLAITSSLLLALSISACNSSPLIPSLQLDMLKSSSADLSTALPDLSSNCPLGTLDCDGDAANGCETFYVNNPVHCGACDVQCGGATPVCSGGQCRDRPNVLLVTANFPQNYMDVQDKLNATGAFSAVDVFSTDNANPAVEALLRYGAILYWDAGGPEQPSEVPLAAYFLAGGRVVVGDATTLPYDGAFIPYMTIVESGGVRVIGGDGLGAILDPRSPLMVGVNKIEFPIQAIDLGKIVNGASAVANWRSGEPFITTGTIAGRRRVDLHFPPYSQDADDEDGWIGDGAILIKNALLYE